MSYTPINWQTGDTITAEKLNKMDNGWSVSSTQLFSETVTTTDNEGVNYGELTYSTFINADNIVVTFDGTEYTCSNYSSITNASTYGATEVNGVFDFSTYPFCFNSEELLDGIINEIFTNTPGEHTVVVTMPIVQTSTDFDAAVLTVNEQLGIIAPLKLITGETTKSEAIKAIESDRIVFFKMGPGDMRFVYFIDDNDGSVGFIPEAEAVTVGFNAETGLFFISGN